jgi:hypothetical protein
MALTDPQVVTINAVQKSMPRVSTSGTSAKYQMPDQAFALVVSHSVTKDGRIRSLARLDQRAIVVDPLDSNKSDYDTLGFYVVVDRPEYGFTQTQLEQLITGFKTWLDNTMVGKLFGQES